MTEVVGHASENLSSSNRLFDHIRLRILSGEFEPGSKLTETDLAQRSGVNRAPLREALLRLEERRLIERVPFSGMRVFQPSIRMLRELYDIREVLEGLACRRAAERISPQEMEELSRIAQEQSKRLAVRMDEEIEELPPIRDFHTRIAEIADNLELQRILSGEIWFYLRSNYRRWVKSRAKKVSGALQHEWIIDAIKGRDGDLAEILMRRHVRASRLAWEELLDKPSR